MKISIPEAAENLSFQRSFGSLDSFLPANDLVPIAGGWADPMPIRPGGGALTLLTTYELPYESGMAITHPMNYPAASSTIILADNGVEVTGEGWSTSGPEQFQTGEVFLNYNRAAIPAGDNITIELDGRPRLVEGAEGATTNRNQTTELIVGGTALILAAIAGIFLWRGWQARQTPDEVYVAEAGAAVTQPATPATPARMPTLCCGKSRTWITPTMPGTLPMRNTGRSAKPLSNS
ncbi:MAG: hypothetical protein R3C44_10415 [Chloroflexota bacterium]